MPLQMSKSVTRSVFSSEQRNTTMWMKATSQMFLGIFHGLLKFIKVNFLNFVLIFLLF